MPPGIRGPLAQSVEHLTFNQVVAGSIPARLTSIFDPPIFSCRRCVGGGAIWQDEGGLLDPRPFGPLAWQGRPPGLPAWGPISCPAAHHVPDRVRPAWREVLLQQLPDEAQSRGLPGPGVARLTPMPGEGGPRVTFQRRPHGRMRDSMGDGR